MPWEETENYIRSGHGSTDCDRMRTKTLSAEQGIKAIICFKGDKSSIQSYLFTKAKDWTMSKAKAWFKAHKEEVELELHEGRMFGSPTYDDTVLDFVYEWEKADFSEPSFKELMTKYGFYKSDMRDYFEMFALKTASIGVRLPRIEMEGWWSDAAAHMVVFSHVNFYPDLKSHNPYREDEKFPPLPGESEDEKEVRVAESTWRKSLHESIHVDFVKVLSDFVRIFGDLKGRLKFDKWVVSYGIDVEKPYSNQAQLKECWGEVCEAYNWAKPLIKYLKEDDEAKYWKVRALTANVSMGPARADYTDLVELERSARTLTWRPLNLNHDHAKRLPFPENRVDWAEYEDNAVECIIRIHNSQVEVQQALENGDIVNPSIEGEPRGGYRTKDGRKVPKWYNFTELALLEKGVTLPGIPATYGFEPLVFNESLGRSLAESLSVERDREEESEMSQDEKGIKEQPNVTKLAEAMSEEEIKAKIAEVQAQIDALPDTKTDPKYEILYAEMNAWKDALADLIKIKTLGEAIDGMDICGQCRFYEELSDSTVTKPAVTGEESDTEVSISKGAIGPGVGRCSITEKLIRKNDSACTDARSREQATDLDRTKETIGEMVMKDKINELEEKVLRAEQAKSREIEDHVKTKVDLTEAADKVTRVTQGLAVEQNKNVRLRESARELTGKLEKAMNTIPELEVRLTSAEGDVAFYKEANKDLEEKFEVQKKALVEAKDEVTRVLIKTNEESTKRATAVQEAINAEQEKGRLSKEVAELTERIAELTREVSNTARIRAETAKQNLSDQMLIKELREKDEEKTKTIRELKRRISKMPKEIIIE